DRHGSSLPRPRRTFLSWEDRTFLFWFDRLRAGSCRTSPGSNAARPAANRMATNSPLPRSSRMTTTAALRTPNDFAADLYAPLAASPGNLLFSPYSANVALGVALAGARGQPRQILADLLGAGEDWRQTYAGLVAETDGRPGEERLFRLATANRLLA